MSFFGSYSNRADPASVSAPPTVSAPAITASRMPTIPRGTPVSASGTGTVSAFGNTGTLSGSLSLGFLAGLILVLILAYTWTRNVQGGG